jgi:hypothetical protein
LICFTHARADQFFYDFSEYSTGDIATVSSGDWTTQGTLTSWTRQVVTDAGATGGQALVVQDDGANWGDQFSAIVNDIAGATTGDIEIVARWRLATLANLTGTPVAGPVLIASNNASYGVRVASATSVRGTEFAGATANNTIGAAFTVSTIANNAYVWTRIGRSGSTIRVKFWNDGETEPVGWQGSATNTAISSVKAGVAFYDYNAGPYTVDVIGIGTGGDSAPTSAPGADDTPDAFSFTDQSSVALSSTITSAAVTITGIDVSITCTATGGTIDLNADGNFQATQDVDNNDQIRARHTSSGSYSTAVNTVVDCNGVSDTFTSTTEAASSGAALLGIYLQH